jgi:sugar phosphate isomerase/epimerase
LHYAQLCDAPTAAQIGRPFTVEEMVHTARCARLFPGEGGIDVKGLFAALPAQLPVSVEVVNFEREQAMTPLAWARECLRVSRDFLEPQT